MSMCVTVESDDRCEGVCLVKVDARMATCAFSSVQLLSVTVDRCLS